MSKTVIQSDRTIAWRHTAMCLLVLAAIGLPLAAAQILMRNDTILLPHRIEAWKRSGGFYVDNRFYDDDANQRLLLDVLPHADYSQGGVYFIGSSRFALALATFELPPREQRLISNYAIGGATQTEQDQFIKYLIEEHGLIQAGGNKTLIVFDLCFGNGNHAYTLSNGGPDHEWQYVFTHDGFYTYDYTAGLHQVRLSPLTRMIRVARIRDDAFWKWFEVTVAGQWLTGRNITYRAAVVPPQQINAAKFVGYWDKLLGPDWKSGIDAEMDDFSRTLDYLRSQHVNVAAVCMPEGTWFDNYPPAVYYRRRASELMASKSIPVYDFSHLLPDSYFTDSAHLNYSGVHIIQPRLMQIARDFLKHTGALPANP